MAHLPVSALSLAALSLAVVGCSTGRPPYPFGTPPFRPLTDAQLVAILGTYPNPGDAASRELRDSAGRIVEPPPTAAFGAEIVSFRPGSPAAIPEGTDPRQAIGAPDFTTDIHDPPRALSLGNGGSVVLRLVGDPLVDGPGPDLWIYEIGPSAEAVFVDISEDGKSWRRIGRVPGGRRAIDIGQVADIDESFRYVRITDVPDDGGDSDWWSGADIDAIGASRVPTPAPAPQPPPPHVVLPAEVLFEFDSATLTDGGRAALQEMVEQALARSGVEVLIEGHTDDVGGPEYNLALSERRARAVADHFAQRGVDQARIRAIGLGETRPAASGTDDDARRKNRRVEISFATEPK